MKCWKCGQDTPSPRKKLCDDCYCAVMRARADYYAANGQRRIPAIAPAKGGSAFSRQR